MKKYIFWSKWKFALVTAFGLAFGISGSGIALVLSSLLDYMVSDVFEIWKFVFYCSMAIIYSMVMYGLYFAYLSLVSWYCNKATKRLSDDVFAALLKMNTASFRKQSTSTYYSILMQDTTRVLGQYFYSIMLLPMQITIYISAAAISFYINWAIAVALIAFSFMIFGISHIYDSPNKKANLAITESFAKLSQEYQACLNGQGVIRSFKAYDYANQKQSEKSTKAFMANFKQAKIETAIDASSNTFTTILQFAVMLASGILSYYGKITIGSVLAFIQLASNMYGPFASIASYLAKIKGMKEVNSNILSFICKQKVTESVEPLSIEGNIDVESLSFSYGNNKIISNFSYHFEKGKKYLVQGESGCGKSTLLSLLADSGYTYEGTIAVDGHDYKEIDFSSLVGSVVLCEQQSILFPGSLKENICFGFPYEEEKFNKTIALSGLTEFEKERNRDMELDPELSNGSGGEIQRIALARAIYHEPKILLLDEITSGLDKENTNIIQELILSIPATVIFVSHNVDQSLQSRFDGIINM